MITDRERFISLLDNDAPRPSDAIILLEGDGDTRVEACVELLRAGMAPRIVVSGGLDAPDRGCLHAARLRDLLLARGVQPAEVVLEDRSLHTRDQALEVFGMARRQGWTSMILVASNFHQYRAFLTFLQVMRESGLELALHNCPARALPWFKETGWGRRVDLLDSEFEKIEAYRSMGHVAGFQDALAYLRWKECGA